MRTTSKSTITALFPIIPILEARFTSCFDSVQLWMNSNRLRLNGSKTEFIWLGSSRRLPRRSFDPLLIGDSIVHPAASVRDLGVILDPALSFANHVAKLTGISFYHIRQLRSIRHSLTVDSCHSLVRALIVSRLDYCNGLLGGAPAFLLDRLSGVLRAAARVVLQLPRTSQISDAMKGAASLARHSSTSQLQAVRPCVPVPPWFCTTLLNEMLRSCHPWTIGSAIGRFCEGSTRRAEN